MKKILFLFTALLFSRTLEAQQLAVPEIFQEQTEWCWAGVSKSVLDYYGTNIAQCDIADYARTVIKWRNFGSTDCCINPNLGCNYWNYNWGYPGSIQDILVNFANIQNYGVAKPLSLTEISKEIKGGRPFIVRWGWTSGGGHFVVGHGINGNNISYMNPWIGEGYHISTYNWLVNDGVHEWTHTNVLTTNLGTSEFAGTTPTLEVYPNPAHENITINSEENIESLRIFDVSGKQTGEYSVKDKVFHIDVSKYEKGLYLFDIRLNGNSYYKKILIN